MFYSHEVLTSRKYGVATVWLMATLGSKSGLGKKVKRQQIFDVNIPKACKTILQPDAPMALRLQGSLLFGVSRVYGQQCEYMLTDVQNTRNGMHKMLMLVSDLNLDIEIGRNKADHLQLQDDPAFSFDLALPHLDFDESLLRISLLSDPGDKATSIQSRASGAETNLPGGPVSSSSIGGYGLDLPSIRSGSDAGRLSALMRTLEDTGLSTNFADEDEFLAEIDVEFDEEGNLRDLGQRSVAASPLGEQHAQRAQQLGPSLPALTEVEFSTTGANIMILDNDDRLSVIPSQEQHDQMSHGAEAGGSGDGLAEHLGQPTGDSAAIAHQDIPQVTRRARQSAIFRLEDPIEISRRELQDNNLNYLLNMAVVSEIKQSRMSATNARKHALDFLAGLGVSSSGHGLGADYISSPLFSDYSGERLLNALAGGTVLLRRAEVSEAHGLMQSSPDLLRAGREQASPEDGVTALDDEGMVMDTTFPNTTTMEPEIGRELETPLADRQSIMPWNSSAIIRSSILRGSSAGLGEGSRPPTSRMPSYDAQGTSSAVGLDFSDAVGRGHSGVLLSRSASPSTGRGRQATGGRLRGSSIAPVLEQLPESEDILMSEAIEDYHLNSEDSPDQPFTQRTDTQLVTTQFNQQAENFLEFVRLFREDQDGPEVADGAEVEQEITFDELLPPEQTNYTVATQGFVHLLTLATRGMLAATQLQDVWAGQIRLRIVG